MSTNLSIPVGLRSAAGADNTSETAKREQIALAAREFEAMFLLQMLKQMRQSMLTEDSEGPGLGADTMTETADVELSRYLAGNAGGLYDVLTKAFSGVPGQGAAPSAQLAALPAAAAIAPRTTAATVVAPAPAHVARPSTAAGTPSAAIPDDGSGLQLPDGRISSKFGWRSDPFTGAKKFHKGVDIAAAYGEEVEAAGAGRVVFAGVQGAYGHTVVLEHEGGIKTRYAHLSQIDVAQGDVVPKGVPVGRVGRSGRATGAHLHFEVLEGEKPVNPLRAQQLAGGLKVARGHADYPTGTSRMTVPTGANDEN